MAHESYKASAPGSLMLFGEHGVLHGRSALVCAIDRRMHATLTPRDDKTVNIKSSLGKASFAINAIEPNEALRFVIAAIEQVKDRLKTGFDLEIHSEFTHQAGLGSSAAVTVATCAVLERWLGGAEKDSNPQKLLEASIAAIRAVQGLGSGADAAASVYGGVVLYKADPPTARKLRGTHPLTIIFSGSKVSTVDVVKQVESVRTRIPDAFGLIFDLMGKSAEDSAEAIEEGRWQTVADLMNLNQGLMDAIGVSNGKLAGMIYALRKDPGILAAKISGAGLGDCVIGLGSPTLEAFSYQQLPLAVTSIGFSTEAHKG